MVVQTCVSRDAMMSLNIGAGETRVCVCGVPPPPPCLCGFPVGASGGPHCIECRRLDSMEQKLESTISFDLSARMGGGGDIGPP